MPVNHALCNSDQDSALQCGDSLSLVILENSTLSLGNQVQSINNRCIHLLGGRVHSIPPCPAILHASIRRCRSSKGEVKIFHCRKNLHHFYLFASSSMSQRISSVSDGQWRLDALSRRPSSCPSFPRPVFLDPASCSEPSITSLPHGGCSISLVHILR